MRALFFFILFILLFPKANAKKVIERPTPELKRVYHVLPENPEVKQGEYEEYFELKLFVKGQYENNLKTGVWKRFFPSGKTQIEASYLKGKKDGTWKYYFPNGGTKAIIHFKNNQKVGTWEGFSADGKKLSILNYHGDSLFGEQVLYHPNGEIAEYQEIFIQDGKKVTKTSKYYDNGKIYQRYQLINGHVSGVYEKYHPTGIIWEELEAENDSLFKVKANKTPSGKPFYKGDFRDGTGELRRYHGNGKLYSIEQYKYGEKFGKAQYFDDDILRIEGFYYKNKPMGTWKYFSIYGKLLEERNFFGTKDYQYLVEYGISGEERFEGEVLFGAKTGTWKAYNFYGDLLYTTNYKFGYEHGTYERFDGTLLLEKGGYFYGEKVGRWKTFNKSQKVVFEEVYTKAVSFDTTTVQRNQFSEKFLPKASFSFEKLNSSKGFPSKNIIEDQYLSNQIETPKEALKLNVSGTVIGYVVVDEFGWITKIEIQRGIGFGCDEEVIRVLHLLPNYEPAFLHGIPKQITEYKEFTFGGA